MIPPADELKWGRVSVVICALNEEKNLPGFLTRIPQWIDEVLLVDGHSTDRTLEVARQLRPGIKIISQPGAGKGYALRCGFAHSSGDYVVTMDCDGSMDPAEIGRFIKPLTGGYDVSKGSRFIKDGGTTDMETHRVFGNRVFTILTNVLHGTRYSDLAYGYNAFTRAALDRMKLHSQGFEIETEINIKAKKAGLKVIEVPSMEGKRLTGTSHLKCLRDGWRILMTILRERFAANQRTGTGIS